MIKKLLLINPVQEAKFSLATNIAIRVPPISLGYLAALTPPGWNIKIIDENVEPMTFEDADLVGITAMTSNASRAYEISYQYRQKGIKTVIGGVHASMLPDEAIRFVDSVVLGEAEIDDNILVSSLINRFNHLTAFARICCAVFVHTKGFAPSFHRARKAFIAAMR